MGPDGHTASLFPNHELLNENELLVASISDSPKLPPKRITLTYPVINGGRNVLFVAAGGSKAENLPKVIPSDSTMSHNGGDVVSINHDDVNVLLPLSESYQKTYTRNHLLVVLSVLSTFLSFSKRYCCHKRRVMITVSFRKNSPPPSIEKI